MLVSKGDSYTYLNLNKYITQGGQFIAAVEKGNIQLSAGISYTGIYNEMENAESQTPFTYGTEMNGSAEYRFPKTKTSVALYWKYNGHQPFYVLNESNSVNTVELFKGESYSIVDLSIVQPFFNNRLSVGAGVKNILDVTSVKSFQPTGAHQSANDVALVGMGRSLFLRIQLQLSK